MRVQQNRNPVIFIHMVSRKKALFHEQRTNHDGTALNNDDRTALVLLSLTEKGNIRIERTYYAMICEIDPIDKKIIFQLTEEIA